MWLSERQKGWKFLIVALKSEMSSDLAAAAAAVTWRIISGRITCRQLVCVSRCRQVFNQCPLYAMTPSYVSVKNKRLVLKRRPPFFFFHLSWLIISFQRDSRHFFFFFFYNPELKYHGWHNTCTFFHSRKRRPFSLNVPGKVKKFTVDNHTLLRICHSHRNDCQVKKSSSVQDHSSVQTNRKEFKCHRSLTVTRRARGSQPSRLSRYFSALFSPFFFF